MTTQEKMHFKVLRSILQLPVAVEDTEQVKAILIELRGSLTETYKKNHADVESWLEIVDALEKGIWRR